MRITTGMMASRSIAAINRSYELMNKYQTQLETQKKDQSSFRRSGCCDERGEKSC